MASRSNASSTVGAMLSNPSRLRCKRHAQWGRRRCVSIAALLLLTAFTHAGRFTIAAENGTKGHATAAMRALCQQSWWPRESQALNAKALLRRPSACDWIGYGEGDHAKSAFPRWCPVDPVAPALGAASAGASDRSIPAVVLARPRAGPGHSHGRRFHGQPLPHGRNGVRFISGNARRVPDDLRWRSLLCPLRPPGQHYLLISLP